MSRELDLSRLSPGDAVIVDIDQQREDSAIADTVDTHMSIIQCDTPEGEPVQAEILDIDRANQEILAVPKDIESPIGKYAIGDELTVSVNNVTKGNAHVSLGPKSTLKVLNYTHKLDDIDVIVVNIREEDNTVLAKRLVKINQLSRSKLNEADQTGEIELRVSAEMDIENLNVFISHLIAAQNWDVLEKLFQQHQNSKKANIDIAWDLFEKQSDYPSAGLRDVLYTAVADNRALAPVFSCEYLGVVIEAKEYPVAWRSSIQGNFAAHCSAYGIEPNYSSVSPVKELEPEATIEADQLIIQARQSDSRNHSVNRKLRNVWNERCAVCGHGAESRNDKTGIEGSHIYPVKYGGPDQKGNILPMCRNDHWAFENGWIAITDRYTVDYYSDIPDSVASLLNVNQGDQLLLRDGYEPDRDYIALHRQIHGFDSIQVGNRFPIVLDSIGVNGAQTHFPSGDTIVVPYDAVREVDNYTINVVVTDTSGGNIIARPIKSTDSV
jgi:hypothetical protein